MSSDTDLEGKFQNLATKWRRETGHLSSITQMSQHPAYREIVVMGSEIVPIILRDLRDNGPDHWFWALCEITGENPVPPEIAGQISKMTQVWIEWGRSRGLID